MTRSFCKKDFDDLAKMMDNEQDFNAFKDYQILSLDRQLFHNHLAVSYLPPLPEGKWDHLWAEKTEFHHLPIKPPFNIATPLGYPWSTREIPDYGAQLLYETFSVNDIVDLLTEHLEATRVV